MGLKFNRLNPPIFTVELSMVLPEKNRTVIKIARIKKHGFCKNTLLTLILCSFLENDELFDATFSIVSISVEIENLLSFLRFEITFLSLLFSSRNTTELSVS